MERKLYSLRNGLNKARKRKGMRQEDLAREIGVILKTVMNWEQGIVNPDLETMIILSKMLDCDLDYLTGRLEETTHDIHFVHEFTGLSEAAISKIRNPALNNPIGKTLSHMIESERFGNLITTYRIFLDFLSKIQVSDLERQTDYELNEDNVILGRNEAANHFKQEVSIAMIHLCEDDYTQQMQKVIQDIPGSFTMSMESGKIKLELEEELLPDEEEHE